MGTQVPGQEPGKNVVLNLELVTRRQALTLLWVVWLFLGALVGFSVALLVLNDDTTVIKSEPRSNLYFKASLGLACASLAALLVCGAAFALRCRRTTQQGRRWPDRHKALATEAGAMLVLQTLICSSWVAPTAVVVAADCLWPAQVVAIFSIIHWNLVNLLFLFMTARMHGMCIASPAATAAMEKAQDAADMGELAASIDVESGQHPVPQLEGAAPPAALDNPPKPELHAPSGPARGGLAQWPAAASEQGAAGALNGGVAPCFAITSEATGGNQADSRKLLVMDLPLKEQLRLHVPKLVLWVILETATIVRVLKQFEDQPDVISFSPDCKGGDEVNCDVDAREIAGQVVEVACLFAYALLWMYYKRRAFCDHLLLPYSEYRMTRLYILVQSRYIMLCATAMFVDFLLVVLIGINSCWTHLHTQMGMPPVEISLCIMVIVAAFLFMPAQQDAPISQAALQEFSWTLGGLAEAQSARSRKAAAMASLGTPSRDALLPSMLPDLLPDHSQRAAQAAAQLRQEPMFCMELSLRLFYWTRLAKLYGVANDLVTEDRALKLFGLEGCECFTEAATDTKGILGWGPPGAGVAVLSFRGTSSGTNALHDMQLWRTVHEPKRWWLGMLVMVHAGFYKSWRANGFDQRVLAKLEEVVAASGVQSSAFTFYVTGHSLGGALSQLAAFEIAKRWPSSRLVVYTFGAPRVGNLAWVHEYDAAVPETWCIINAQDPVPRVPKFAFHPSGHLVVIGVGGDLLTRPSYFELSVLGSTGGSVFHHRNGAYSRSYAEVLKAQFIPTKSLPDGEEGVRELAQSLDIGAALLLDHMDMDSLADPGVRPIAHQPKPFRPVRLRVQRGRTVAKTVLRALRLNAKPDQTQVMSEVEGSVEEGGDTP